MNEKLGARRMRPEERSRLDALDAALRSEDVRAQFRPIVERVRAELARKAEALMTWKPIPLSTFRRVLPPEIRSAWVFILRAGADTGAERHPNSHQRMMSFEGSGDLQTGDPGQWQSNILISDPAAPLEQRWISIPPNVWHRPVVGRDADWAVDSRCCRADAGRLGQKGHISRRAHRTPRPFRSRRYPAQLLFALANVLRVFS